MGTTYGSDRKVKSFSLYFTCQSVLPPACDANSSDQDFCSTQKRQKCWLAWACNTCRCSCFSVEPTTAPHTKQAVWRPASLSTTLTFWKFIADSRFWKKFNNYFPLEGIVRCRLRPGQMIVWQKTGKKEGWERWKTSVADTDPNSNPLVRLDPHGFWPPGSRSGSIRKKNGTGSTYH